MVLLQLSLNHPRLSCITGLETINTKIIFARLVVPSFIPHKAESLLTCRNQQIKNGPVAQLDRATAF